MAKDIPLGILGEPLDIAYAALYLASAESAFYDWDVAGRRWRSNISLGTQISNAHNWIPLRAVRVIEPAIRYQAVMGEILCLKFLW